MRLVNLGAGEICDRLSILALKILYARLDGRETKHFETERAALLTQIQGRTLNGSWFPPFLELQAVNAAGWQAQIDMRGRQLRDLNQRTIMSGDGGTNLIEAGALAFRMLAWNDRRSELIDEINKLAGEFLGEEKVSVRRGATGG